MEEKSLHLSHQRVTSVPASVHEKILIENPEVQVDPPGARRKVGEYHHVLEV